MRRRIALWVAVAGLGAAAVGLVVATRGGGDGGDTAAGLPKLPVSATGEAQEDEAARMASDSVGFAAAGQYVPGDGLPSLGGTAPSYRLTADVTEASVRRLAEALGISGEPTSDGAGYWTVVGDEMTLSVNGLDGSWSAFRGGALELAPEQTVIGGIPHPTVVPDLELLCPDYGVEAPGPAQVDDDVREPEPPEPCEAPLPADGGDEPPVTLPPVEPVPPARPENLPSQDGAERIALDLLAATGADVDGAEVRVDDGVTEWYVAVEPRVDGLPAVGLGMYVGVGDEGRISSVSGTIAKPEKLGDYPLLDTRAALDRLNESRVYFGGPAIDTGPALEPETTVPGDVSILPMPDTVPIEPRADIPVTDAEIVLIAEFTTDVDDTTTYLVPAYRFTAEDGSAPEVNAVVDDLLERPDPIDPGPIPNPDVADPSTEPNSGGGSSGGEPGDPGQPTSSLAPDDPTGSVDPSPPTTEVEAVSPDGG